MRTFLLLAAAAFVVVGCVGLAPPTPQIIYVTSPPSVATPVPPTPSTLPTPTVAETATPLPPTPRITPRPATPAPVVTATPTAQAGDADVYLGDVKLIAWKDEFSDYVSYQVIQELQNLGTGWAQIAGFESDYSIYDQDGGVVTTGFFLYVYPEFLAPGETGYLIDESVQEGYRPADFATVEVDGRYEDVAGPPDNLLEVSNTNLRRAGFGDGVEATGEVENVGTLVADSAHAAAIYFDAAGEIIGSSYTNLIENVDPGEKKAFETISSNPLRLSDIADYVVIASAD